MFPVSAAYFHVGESGVIPLFYKFLHLFICRCRQIRSLIIASELAVFVRSRTVIRKQVDLRRPDVVFSEKTDYLLHRLTVSVDLFNCRYADIYPCAFRSDALKIVEYDLISHTYVFSVLFIIHYLDVIKPGMYIREYCLITAVRSLSACIYGNVDTFSVKSLHQSLSPTTGIESTKAYNYGEAYVGPQTGAMVADPIIERMSAEQLEKSIANTERLMKEAAKNMDFLQAAQYRDELIRLKDSLGK